MATKRPAKLFGTTDRNESHRKLSEILAAGEFPLACCIEDPNDEKEPYQVWTAAPWREE